MNSHDTHTDHIDTDYIHPKLRDLVHSVGLVGWTRIIVGNWAILGAIILGLFIHLKSVANFDQAVLNWVLTIRIDALTAFMKAVTHLFSPTVSVIEAVAIGLLIWSSSVSNESAHRFHSASSSNFPILSPPVTPPPPPLSLSVLFCLRCTHGEFRRLMSASQTPAFHGIDEAVPA